MLTHWPENSRAITTKRVWDITEDVPIPRGQIVNLIDFDSCGDESGVWIIEWQERIYQATPDELRV